MKIGMVQRLAWSLDKADTQICEVFHIKEPEPHQTNSKSKEYKTTFKKQVGVMPNKLEMCV